MTRSRTAQVAGIAALALTVATCGDPTGPKNVLTIALTVLSGTVTETSQDGANPGVTCTVPIRATATGPGRAFWLGSTLRWFAGPTRDAPVDTAVFSPAVMETDFGSSEMTEGLEQELQLEVGFGLPFEWELEVRYEVGSQSKSAKIRASCGLLPPSGSVPQPTVAAPLVTGNTLLRTGDTLTFMVTGSSPYALWATRLLVTGPVQQSFVWAEGGAQTMLHYASVIVPPGAVRDAAVVATVSVLDVMGAVVTRETITPKIVTDLEVPALTSARFLDWSGREGGVGIPQFELGDTLAVRFRATDDIGLGHLVYEADGPGVSFRDSLPFSAIADSTALIPVTARWAGVNRVSVQVRDVALKRSVNTVTTPVDSINFFPSVTRPSTTIDVGNHWSSGTLDGARQRFYFPRRDARIEVVDATTMVVLPSIPTGRNPAALDATAADDSLVVALPDAGIAIVDLRGATPVTTIVPMRANSAAGGPVVTAFPYAVVRDAIGRWVVWAILDGTNESLMMFFDPVAQTFTHIPRDVGPKQAVYVSQSFLTSSADRSSMVTIDNDCVRLYRSITARFSACHPMLQWPLGIPAAMFSPTGDVITIGHGVYHATLGIAAQRGLARPRRRSTAANRP